MGLPVLLFGGAILYFGLATWLNNDPYPNHVYAIPSGRDTGAIPKRRPTEPAEFQQQIQNNIQLTAQDQRAYIAVSAQLGESPIDIQRKLKI